MAQTSKRKRALRQARRRATIAEKYGDVMARHLELVGNHRAASEELYRAKALLFALIAQAGGSLEVTHGTQAQVLATMPRLSLSSASKEGDALTLVVTLVEAPTPEEEAAGQAAADAIEGKSAAVEITRIADDEEWADHEYAVEPMNTTRTDDFGNN